MPTASPWKVGKPNGSGCVTIGQAARAQKKTTQGGLSIARAGIDDYGDIDCSSHPPNYFCQIEASTSRAKGSLDSRCDRSPLTFIK
jgi:hypothetical protein